MRELDGALGLADWSLTSLQFKQVKIASCVTPAPSSERSAV
jgi:hypothetical protein